MLFDLPLAVLAQNPTYEAHIKNDLLVTTSEIQFDTYVKRMGSTPLEAYGLQHCFIFDDAIFNGGIPTITYIAGTSQMNVAQEQTNAWNLTSIVSGMRVAKHAAKIPSGPGTGTVVSSTGDGTRFGRFKLTTTPGGFDFSGPYRLGYMWNFNQVYRHATKYQAYVGGIPTDITEPSNHYHFEIPVELVSFSAHRNGYGIELNWKTATEVNNYGFEVERSVNNSGFYKIGFVNGAGNSNSPKEYSFIDNKLNSGKYIYRLKIFDTDGTFEYSDPIKTEVALPKDYAISQNYPNPFNPTTRIDYQLQFDSKVTLELYGITGERIATIIDNELSAGYYTADVNASTLNLASGVYVYRISAIGQNDQNFFQVKKLMFTK